MGAITPELQYLADQLEILEPSSKLGGIYAFKPGYHSTRADNQANWPSNYSIKDSVDKGGPSDKAAAIDWTFPDAQAGNYATIDKYSSRLLASGQNPEDDRLNGWREFYGQCDNDDGVEGWDFRYVVAATSDSSHLWHIHLSCDRDKVTSRENMDKLLAVLRGDPMSGTGIIGLKKGDARTEVEGLKNMLRRAGYNPDTDPTHTTNKYDSACSAAVLACRKANGSTVSSGDEISGNAWAQIEWGAMLAAAREVAAGIPVGPAGPQGPAGPKGDAAVLADGSTLTVNA